LLRKACCDEERSWRRVLGPRLSGLSDIGHRVVYRVMEEDSLELAEGDVLGVALGVSDEVADTEELDDPVIEMVGDEV
jgi:hypothetical protein